MELLPPSWRRKGAGDRTQLYYRTAPARPRPLRGHVGRPSRPAPKKPNGTGVRTKCSGRAAPRGARGGERFSNTHYPFLLHPPPLRSHAAGAKSGISARLPAGRHKIRRAVLARALPVYARTPVPFFLLASSHFIDTGTFVGSRPPSAPVLYALHQHRYFSWIAQFFSTGTLDCFERDDARY